MATSWITQNYHENRVTKIMITKVTSRQMGIRVKVNILKIELN